MPACDAATGFSRSYVNLAIRARSLTVAALFYGSAANPLTLDEDNVSGFKNLYLQTDYGQLNCLSEITGIGDYSAVTKMSKRIRLDWGFCRILDFDGLILAKEAMNRPQDREVLTQLRAIRDLGRR